MAQLYNPKRTVQISEKRISVDVDPEQAVKNLQRWLKNHKNPVTGRMETVTDSTMANQSKVARSIIKSCGFEQSDEWLELVRDHYMDDRAPGTVKNYLFICENLLAAHGHPEIKIAKPEYTEQESRYYSEADIMRVIAQTKRTGKGGQYENLRDRAALTLLWASAMRASELLHMRVENYKVTDKGAYVEVRDNGWGVKTKKERKIPIDPKYTPVMAEWLAYRNENGLSPADYPIMFPTSVGDGGPISYPWFEQMVRQYAERAGVGTALEPVTPHKFRHSMCSHWLNVENVPAPVVQKAMGHSSLQTTLRYIHTSFDDMTRYMWRQ